MPDTPLPPVTVQPGHLPVAPAPPPPEEEPEPLEEEPESPIDLATSGSGAVLKSQEVPPYTTEWAKTAGPFAVFVLCLIAAVIIVPFIFFLLPYPRGVYMTQALDWAKTVLAPVVGFGGAVVGYYFGARR